MAMLSPAAALLPVQLGLNTEKQAQKYCQTQTVSLDWSRSWQPLWLSIPMWQVLAASVVSDRGSLDPSFPGSPLSCDCSAFGVFVVKQGNTSLSQVVRKEHCVSRV